MTAVAGLAVLAVLTAAGCAARTDESDRLDPGRVPVPESAVDDGTGLTEAGTLLAGDRLGHAPRYRIDATVDPGSGEVEGTVVGDLPIGEFGTATLRYFPALVDPGAEITDVTVDGAATEHRLEGSLLTVPLDDREGGDRVQVTAGFRYEIPETAAPGLMGGLDQITGEDGLQPADVGLLGRRDGVVTLGHWFPIWVPDDLGAEPVPDGYGDIGNFPAATIEAEVSEPDGWTLVTGGTRVDEDGDRVVEGGNGLRDLGMVMIEAPASTETAVGGTSVRVLAGQGTDPVLLDEVQEEAATSVEVLSGAFGPYPWTELEVVATPLGSGVGGMEWPGMIWIESSIFAGGLPGLGDLQLDLDDLGLGDLDLDDLDLGPDGPGGEGTGGEGTAADLEALLQDLLDQLAEQGLDLGDPEDLGLGDLTPGDVDLGDLDLDLDLGEALDPGVLEATRAWTVAHEVGHQWWHAVVGNDSIESPAVDEPLAQHSACLVFEEAWPDGAGRICEGNTAATYRQMRSFGVEDARADQPSDGFDSSLQYGGVVYGKAPGVYTALAGEFGDDALVGALATVVEDHAFDQLDGDDLRVSLGRSLDDDDRATVDELWARWMEGEHGDDDLLD